MFLLVLVLFYVELSIVSMASVHQGGWSFWETFQKVWYQSIIFYAIISPFLFGFGLLVVKFQTKIIPQSKMIVVSDL
ncbi:hypothetical protein AO843_17340 [Lysinibacillus sp. ZYM-1]|nr:hypothetical protein AO843_17340 [Lysinibacillus sp. ZYM-1]